MADPTLDEAHRAAQDQAQTARHQVALVSGHTRSLRVYAPPRRIVSAIAAVTFSRDENGQRVMFCTTVRGNFGLVSQPPMSIPSAMYAMRLTRQP